MSVNAIYVRRYGYGVRRGGQCRAVNCLVLRAFFVGVSKLELGPVVTA